MATVADYQDLACFKCKRKLPGFMTICVNTNMTLRRDGLCRDGYSALCSTHRNLVGHAREYCDIAKLPENRAGPENVFNGEPDEVEAIRVSESSEGDPRESLDKLSRVQALMGQASDRCSAPSASLEIVIGQESDRPSLSKRVAVIEDSLYHLENVLPEWRIQSDTLAKSLSGQVAEMQESIRRLDASYIPESRVSLIENKVQFIDSLMSDRVSVLEDKFSSEMIKSMSASDDRGSVLEDRELAQKTKERVGILEEAVQYTMTETSKVMSEVNKVVSQMRTEYASAERLAIVEGMVQGITDINLNSWMLKESGRVSLLEQSVQRVESQITEVIQALDACDQGSDDRIRGLELAMKRIMADDRISILEDTLRDQVEKEKGRLESVEDSKCMMERMAEMNIESRMAKEAERLSVLENKLERIEGHVCKDDQAGDDRFSALEEAVQRIMAEEEIRIMEELGSKLTSEIKYQTQMSKVASEKEGAAQRMLEMNIESQILKESERLSLLENKVQRIESQVCKGDQDSERLSLLENKVQCIESQVCKGDQESDALNAPNRIVILEDAVNRIVADDRVTILEGSLRVKDQKWVKTREKISVLEEAVEHTMTEMKTVEHTMIEISKVVSEMQTSYAPLERFKVVEGMLERIMDMNRLSKDSAYKASPPNSSPFPSTFPSCPPLAFRNDSGELPAFEVCFQRLNAKVQVLNAKVDEMRMQSPEFGGSPRIQ